MRTTLTLDDDVAAALKRRRAERGTPLRREVNELLRAGLAAVEEAASAEDSEPWVLPTWESKAMITDYEAIKDILEGEDVERYLRLLK